VSTGDGGRAPAPEEELGGAPESDARIVILLGWALATAEADRFKTYFPSVPLKLP